MNPDKRVKTQEVLALLLDCSAYEGYPDLERAVLSAATRIRKAKQEKAAPPVELVSA
jgi:hypothetical protein